jgi:hypothetical protein
MVRVLDEQAVRIARTAGEATLGSERFGSERFGSERFGGERFGSDGRGGEPHPHLADERAA